jgi:hypothetical protein
MKMQEVITRLREEAPLLDKCSKSVDETFQRLCGLLDDFRSAKSDEGRKILADALGDEMNVFGAEYRTLRCSVETVCLVNAEYKEKLGPRGPKKPKDAEGQQMLPGLGDEGGTPTTMGETSTTGGRTPSFMQSGRHG